MPQVCSSVLDAIGDTPLVHLARVGAAVHPRVYAKVEYVNPGGSVKDRIALALIEAAEREGLLQPGGTIVEATSGNTGVGLAMVAAVKGYRCVFVMPDKMSQEKVDLMQAYGAEVVITPTNAETNSPEGYGGVAERLVNEIPNAWRPDQFANLENPEYHYKTTGPEIWEQTEGRITVFVAGIGTGGTISGVGRFLKEQNPKVKIVAADPVGSILSGGAPQPWAVEGIGEDFVPKTFSAHVVDDWVKVSDKESFMAARDVARKEGLLVGGSCGTAVSAALTYAQRCGPEDYIVALCPDTGRNYLSKLYNDDWMQANGFLDARTEPQTVHDLLQVIGDRELIHVSPGAQAIAAVRLLRDNAISQIPVIDDGKVVGSVMELTLARLLHHQRDPHTVVVRDVMGRPMPEVDEEVPVEEVFRILSSGYTAVLARHQQRIAGIITRIDLVTFWGQGVVDQA